MTHSHTYTHTHTHTNTHTHTCAHTFPSSADLVGSLQWAFFVLEGPAKEHASDSLTHTHTYTHTFPSSADLADSIAVGFFFAGGGGKGARKRLIRALSDVPRLAGLGALVPYLARVSAVVAQVRVLVVI